MNRTAVTRWQRVALVATAVLLSTGVATGAGALDSAPAPTAPPVTSEVPTPDTPATVDSATPPDTAASETVPAETDPSVPTETSPSTDPEASMPPDNAPELTAPSAPAVPGGEPDHEEGHEGPTILVNGQPFKGQADPKLEGCSVTLSVADLTDGSHTVVGAIRAGEPSGDATLVSIDTAFDGTEWSETWALDDLVGDLVQKPNGYRIRIVLTIDGGASQESRPFWIACGAEQEGNPFVVVIDKEWRDAEGEVLEGIPAALPDDWAITASSQLGSAVCTYPEGSDELTCEYDNKGSHQGSEEGLYVPGGKDKTFEVHESDLPAGWTTLSGVGTFVARDVCPGGGGGGHEEGGGGHEEGGGGHEEGDAAAPDSHEGEGEERPPCDWTVVNRADAEEPTTPSEPTVPEEPTTPSVPEGSDVASDVVSAPTAASGGADALARTGSPEDQLLITALMLILGGALTVAARRRLEARARA